MTRYSRRSILGGAGLALGGVTLLEAESDYAAAAASSAEETGGWPQYRRDPANTNYGPNVSGPMADYLSEQWTFQTEAPFWSPPTVGDGILYVVEAGAGESATVHALDVDDGSVAWSNEVPRYIHGSPAVVDESVYITGRGDTPSTLALDAESGEVQWRNDGVGSTASPAVENGTVYLTDVSHTVALDRESGDSVWQSDIGSIGEIAVSDGRVYVHTDDELVALDAASGNQLWSYDRPGGGASRKVRNEYEVTPVASSDRVFGISEIGASEEPTEATVYAVDAATGEEQWTASSSRGVPVVADGTVFHGVRTDDRKFGAGGLAARDAETGEEQWRSELLSSQVCVADSLVYAVPRRFRRVRPDENVLVADAETGAVVTQYNMPQTEYDQMRPPLVADDTLYLAMVTVGNDAGGRVYAVTAGDADPEEELQKPEFVFESLRGTGDPPFRVGDELYAVELDRAGLEFAPSRFRPTMRIDYDDDGEFEIRTTQAVYGDGVPTDFTWVYDEPGEHTVTLEVRDKYGRTASVSQTVTIEEEEERPPLGDAEIAVSKRDGLRCRRTFEGSLTGEYTGEVSYYWRFGRDPVPAFDPGESIPQEQTVTRDFESGTHYVRLVVQDDAGRTATATASVEISAG